MSQFWGWYIAIIVVLNLVGSGVLLYVTRRTSSGSAKEGKTTGHVFDGIEEYNNPLPRWWVWSFWATILFSVVYLILYPGLGIYKGAFGWTSAGQLAEEQQQAKAQYGPMFAKYGQMSFNELVHDKAAMNMGERLFSHYCSTCHGSDKKGAKGYPNLTDNDWLYGGSPEAIEQSILHGRNGIMPAFGQAIGGDDAVADVVSYVRSLSMTLPASENEKIARGQAKFAAVCVACHGIDGKGNQLIGAPNLTDDIWLYGGSPRNIAYAINHGRNGHMPAHEHLLGQDKAHILAGYVYSLSMDK